MKEERIVEILGMVDEKYVEEAAPAQAPKRKVYYGWMKWVAAAACVIGVSWFGYNQWKVPQQLPSEVSPGVTLTAEPTSAPVSTPSSAPTSDSTPAPTGETASPNVGLPLLTVGLNDGGMGFEGMTFYDILEDCRVNPWTKEAELETLPVYRNMAYTDGAGVQVWYSEEQLYAKVEEVATLLNTEVISVEYGCGMKHCRGVVTEDKDLCMIKAQTSCGEIKVEGNGMVQVEFEPAIEIPEEYSFTWHDTSMEEAQETIHYLMEQYGKLCAWEQYNVEAWREYVDSSGEYDWEYDTFKVGATLEEQILNYNFARISFRPNSEGKLWMIRFGNQFDCTKELGCYPIISWEAAQSLLLNGDYLTSVPKEYLSEGKVKEEYIAKVELIYRNGPLEEVFMPYYRFYVELTEMADFNKTEGLKVYGAFYVPAVSGEYLSNFPMRDEIYQ